MADFENLSCRDFSALRSRLGLTLNEGATVLGIGVGTMQIYEGKKKRKSNMGPHPAATSFLQAIENDPEFIPPRWPERLMPD